MRLLAKLGYLVLGLALAYAPVERLFRWAFNGRNLARFVENVLNTGIRGRVQVAEIHWRPERWPIEVFRGIGGRPGAVLSADRVRLYDPFGRQVLGIEHVETRLDVWALLRPPVLGGMGDLLIDDLRIRKTVGDDPWALVEEYPVVGKKFPTEIGFLAVLDRGQRPATGQASKPGGIIHIRSADLRDVRLDLRFLAWQASFHGLESPATLRFSARDPLRPSFTYSLTPRAPGGSVDVGPVHVDLVGVVASRFGQFPDRDNAFVYALRTGTTDGAEVDLTGEFGDMDQAVGTLLVDLRLTRAGALARRLSDGRVAGDALAAEVHLAGPGTGPAITAAVRDLDVLVLDFPLRVAEARGAVDLATRIGRLDRLHVETLGGGLVAEAGVNLETQRVENGRVLIGPPIDLAGAVPCLRRGGSCADVVAVAGGGALSGSLAFDGGELDLALHDLALQLGGASLTGEARLDGDRVRSGGLRLALPDGATARVSGRAPLPGRARPEEELALSFSAEVRRLGPYLQRFKLPRVATGVTVAGGSIGGTLAAPVAQATLTVLGVPYVGRTDARLGYQIARGALAVRSLTAHPLGGEVRGSGQLSLAPGGRLSGSLVGEGMELGELPGPLGALLGGRVNVQVDAGGTLAHPTVGVGLTGEGLRVDTYPIGGALVALDADPEGVTVSQLQIGRATSGTLAAHGRLGFDSPSDLSVELSGLPLALLPGVAANRDLDLDGKISLTGHLGGSLARPEISGALSVSGFAVLGDLLGAGRVTLAPAADGRILVAGSLFQDRFTVDGSVNVAADVDARGRVAFRRIEFDEFFPAIADAIGVHGWLTGYAEVGTSPDLHATLHITETTFFVDGATAIDRPVPLAVRNQGEIVVDYDGRTGTARFLQPAHMRTDRPELVGEFTVGGQASPRELALELRGELQLGLLDFYTRRYLDQAVGTARVDLAVGGTPDAPALRGSLDIRDASIRPLGQENALHVPAGRVEVTNDKVTVSGLTIEVDDQQLVAAGELGLDGLRPTTIRANLEGRLPGRLLALALPRQISNANGSAALSLTVDGPVDNPALVGKLEFDRTFEIVPRGFGRELALSGGRVDYHGREVALTGITGRIDEAQFSIVGANGPSASVHFGPQGLAGVDARLKLSGLAYRVPGVLDLELDGDVRLATAPGGNLRLAGRLAVVSGRYFQPFRITDAIVPVRTSERAEPFWKGQPMLESLDLDLTVETAGSFLVSNNLTRLALAGSVRLGGTPPHPTLEGQLQVEEGTFRIPATRVDSFTVKDGAVAFSPYSRFPEETPTIALHAESPFVDYDGNTHQVYLSVTGPLPRLQPELSTDTGLNSAQTIVLITTGRTTDEVRSLVSGRPVENNNTASNQTGTGVATGNPAVGNPMPNSTAPEWQTATDQVLKDLTGEVLAIFIEDPIRKMVGLDSVRFRIGTESVQFSGSKRLLENLIVGADYERSFQGWQRGSVGLDLQLFDNFSAGALVISRPVENEINKSETLERFQLRLHWLID